MANYTRRDIIRQTVRYKEKRFGILKEGLSPRYYNFLKDNPPVKFCATDDDVLQMLFDRVDRKIPNSKGKSDSRLYIDPITDEILQTSVVLESKLMAVDWKCAMCNTPIKTIMFNYSHANFTCKGCQRTYLQTGVEIPMSIVDASVDFTEYCKELLRENRQYFLKNIGVIRSKKFKF